MTLAELRKKLGPGWKITALHDRYGWVVRVHLHWWIYNQDGSQSFGSSDLKQGGPTRKAAVEALAAKLAEMGVL